METTAFQPIRLHHHDGNNRPRPEIAPRCLHRPHGRHGRLPRVRDPCPQLRRHLAVDRFQSLLEPPPRHDRSGIVAGGHLPSRPVSRLPSRRNRRTRPACHRAVCLRCNHHRIGLGNRVASVWGIRRMDHRVRDGVVRPAHPHVRSRHRRIDTHLHPGGVHLVHRRSSGTARPVEPSPSHQHLGCTRRVLPWPPHAPPGPPIHCPHPVRHRTDRDRNPARTDAVRQRPYPLQSGAHHTRVGHDCGRCSRHPRRRRAVVPDQRARIRQPGLVAHRQFMAAGLLGNPSPGSCMAAPGRTRPTEIRRRKPSRSLECRSPYPSA